MKSIQIFLLIFLFTNLCFQCKDDCSLVCYEFDQRQCAGDEWADEVPITDSKSEREEKMKAYLESKDIDVKKVNLVIDYHDAVCEACYICPEGDRFFIEFHQDDEEAFKAMDYLNSGPVDCGEAF